MNDQTDVIKEKPNTEQTIMLLLMRLNQSLATLDAINKFPGSNKPHTIELFRNVYQDIYELSRLVKATLSKELLNNLSVWRNKNFKPNDKRFTADAIMLTESIYDELSDSGMIDVRVRKTATFPIEFYMDRML